jgi:hypothetical protein
MATNANLNVDVKVKGKQQLDGLNRSLGGLGSAAKLATGALAAIGTGKLLKGFVDVGREVEQLNLRFKFLFGSAEEGAKAFKTLNDFAATVPFSLDEIQAASGNLAVVSKDANALGKNLQLTANIAAISGLSFQQTGEQLQRALSGGIAAADIFRERGITALLGFEQGAKVSIEETRKRLIELFGEGGEFGNAADQFAGTLTGTLSMIGDSFRKFQEATAQGFFEELKTQFGDLDQFLKDNEKQIQIIGASLGNFLAKSARAAGTAVGFVKDNFSTLSAVFAGIIALKMASTLFNIARGLASILVVSRSLTALSGVGLGLTAVSIAAGLTAKAEIDKIFEDLEGAVNDSVEAGKKQVNVFDDTNRELGIMKNQLQLVTKATGENTEATRKSGEMMDSHVEAFEEARTMFKRYTDSLGQLGETDLERFTRQRNERLAKLDKEYSTSLGMEKEYQKAKKDIEDEFARNREQLRQKELADERRALDERLRHIQSGNAKEAYSTEVSQKDAARVTMEQGKKTLDVLATQNKRFFELQKAIKITEAIQNTYLGASRALSALPPPFNFIAAALVTAQGFAQVAAIRSQSYPGRDKGGTVVGNQPYMVGESGPELVIPGRTGTVVPNDKLGGTGNQVNVNFTINAIDTSDFNDLLVDRKDMIVGMINQALTERGQRSLLA